MNFLNSRLYGLMENVMNIILLNLIWLIFCLPIVTIFPATAALFSVIRSWQKHGDPRVFKQFLNAFRTDFWQRFLLGIIWLLVTAILLFDFVFFLQLESSLKVVFWGIFIIVSFLFVCTTAFIFPILANYQVNWKQAIRDSFLMSMAYFPTTLPVVILIGLVGLIAYFIPFAFLFVFSIGAHINYALCNRSFEKYNLTKSSTS